MDFVTRYLWIILIVVVILLLVNPKSNAGSVLGALAHETMHNIRALQGTAGGIQSPYM